MVRVGKQLGSGGDYRLMSSGRLSHEESYEGVSTRHTFSVRLFTGCS